MKYTATMDGHIIGPSGKYLKERTDKWGYRVVTIGHKCCFVHRLVLLFFNPVPNNTELQVNHKNENKQDNRLENLEWCTNEYNQHYGTRIQRMKEKRQLRVIAYNPDGSEFGRFHSATEAAKTHGWCQSNIWMAMNGRRPLAYGLRWQLAD